MILAVLALLGFCGVHSASPPTLVDHPIESGLAPLYLDGAWSASSSAAPAQPDLNASVPGDILTDLQSAGRVPDPYFNTTWAQPSFVAAWNTGLWTYRKSFASPAAVVASGAALLVFDGIRMGAMISLNGHQLGNASDQFLRYTFPVGPLLKPAGQPNELSVVFGAELGIDCQGRWTRSNQIDWAPRMPTSDPFTKRSTFGFGIWKSVYLLPVARGGAAITQLISHTFYAGGHPVTMLTDGTHKGFDVNVTAEFWTSPSAAGPAGRLTVLGGWPGAQPLSTTVGAGSAHATVTLPAAQTLAARLWHPNGHGEQVRYNLTATFTPDAAGVAPSVATRLIGFRHIAMVTINDTDPSLVARAPAQDGTGSLTMVSQKQSLSAPPN
jgi:beta-mannosidase